MNEARDILRRHLMAALPQPAPPASGGAMSVEQHSADLMLKQAWDAMDRLAAMGWPMVLVPALKEHGELADKINQAVVNRATIEFPKWVWLGGDPEAAGFVCEDAKQEANVLAGRVPGDDEPVPVPVPVQSAPAKVE